MHGNMEGKQIFKSIQKYSQPHDLSARQIKRLTFKHMKRCVSFNESSAQSAGQTHTHGSQSNCNQTNRHTRHTQHPHGHTRHTNPKHNRRRSYSLRSSSQANQAAAPPCKFAEFNKSYTNRILFPCTIQISHQFHLIHPIFSRSKQNIFEIKTSNSSYMLDTQPFSNLIISTCSTNQDLHIYIKKTTK